MVPFLLIYIIIGLLFVLLSIPLLKQKVPFRHWYGLKVEATLENKQTWFKINKLAGQKLFSLGLGIILFSVLFFIFPIFSVSIYSFVIAVGIFFGAVYSRNFIFKEIKKLEL